MSNVVTQELYVQRDSEAFSADFGGRQIKVIHPKDGILELHVFVDACSVEVFADDGACVITDLLMRPLEPQDIALTSSGGAVQVLNSDVWTLEL